MRVEGNFDLSGEIRRDADKEYNDRPLGYDRAFTRNMARPAYNMELWDPRVELRAYAWPVAPIEIYAKVLHNFRDLTDFWVSEAHTKLRWTRDGGDQESGLESYFFYRQGRLSLGDPIMYITYDQFGSGVATSWWLGRGRFTLPKGRWSGEVNLQNFTGEGNNAFGEDNDGYSLKLRHEYRFNMDWNIANEFYAAEKVFSDQSPGVRRSHNRILGTAFQMTWKSTNLSLQYNLANSQYIDWRTSDNDAFGADLRNLVLFDRPWAGRWGVNATFLKFGRNYVNYLGRGAEWMTFGEQIQNGSYSNVGDNVARDVYTELFWDVPRYEINTAFRHQDKYAMRTFRHNILSRRNEIDVNAKLVNNISLRLMYNRTLYALERDLLDFDQNRFIRDRRLVHSQAYGSLKYNRPWGSLMVDGHVFRRRSVTFQMAGVEASYTINKKLKLLGRNVWLFIERPDMNWTITNIPSDLNASRPSTSVVDPFFSRNSMFLQLQYRPSDNSQIWLEYGQGWHTDDNLSLDGNVLDATRRTDPRLYMKMEMWF